MLHPLGKSCKYFLSDGSTVTGCFSTATPNPHAPDNVRNRYIVKGITSTSDSSRFQLNGSAVIAFDKVVMVVCESVQTGVHAKDEFKTDTEISKMRVKDNELVSAGSEWLSAGDGGLEENSHKTGSWDQVRTAGSEAMRLEYFFYASSFSLNAQTAFFVT